MIQRIFLSFSLLFLSPLVSAGVLHLQDGLNGHFSTEETFIRIGNPNSNYGDNLRIGADGGGIQGLLRFTDLIGNGANQLNAGATVLSAALTLHVTNTSTTNPTIHQMLVDWSENDLTWNNAASSGNFTPAFQADDVDAKSSVIGEFPSATLGDAILDITSVVQSWADGEENHGLLFLSTSTDAAEFATSQDDFHVRPRLTIEFDGSSVPAPASGLLFLFGALVIMRGQTLA